MGAMVNIMVSDVWIEENRISDEKCGGGVVIEKQEINIVINFSLDGMDYKVD